MRIALITGASSGIGREFARQIPFCLRQLDELWIAARRTERLAEIKKNCPIPVRIFDGDLNRDYIYYRLEKELAKEQPDIRMLVNAAGFGKMGDMEEIGGKLQEEMVQLNCRALTKVTSLCLPYLSKGSRIIQVASAAAFAPQPGFAVYAATKAYVLSYSQAIGAELAEKGIAVTAVCPGPVDTEFFDRAGEVPGISRKCTMAKPQDVVRKALKDSRDRKSVSIYGKPMKCARTAARILPEKAVIRVMNYMNRKQKS